MIDRKQLPDRMGFRLLALFMAIILWFYVQGERPKSIYETTQTFANLEVVWDIDNDHVLTGISAETVSVTVRGPEELVQNLTEDDVVVRIDLSGYGPGKHEVELDVALPGKIRLIQIRPQPFEVVVERWIEKEVPVTLSLVEAMPASLLLKESVFEPETVIIDGAASMVNKVTSVVVPYSYEEFGAYEDDVPLVAKDEEGNVVSQISIQDSVSTTLQVWHKRFVPIEVVLEGQLPENVELQLQRNSVEVAGPEEMIENIETIATEIIQVDEVDLSQEYQVGLVLPEGVELLIPTTPVVGLEFVSQEP